GGALGAGDPRVLAALRAGDEAGSAPGAREAGARGDDRPLPARAEALHERRRRRGTARVRRKAEASLEGALGEEALGVAAEPALHHGRLHRQRSEFRDEIGRGALQQEPARAPDDLVRDRRLTEAEEWLP